MLVQKIHAFLELTEIGQIGDYVLFSIKQG